MTREEAIKYLKIDINLSNRRTYVDSELILTNEEFKEAKIMALQTLEQQEVLLKQIEELKKENDFLKKMQQILTKDMSDGQLGRAIFKNLKL